MISVDLPYPDDVAALAEALRSQHVIVQETRGSGDAAGSEARLRELVRNAPFPVYVAVVDAPPDVDAGTGSSRYLATVLSRRIDEPGLYVVSADSNPLATRMVGTGWDDTLFQLQVATDSGAVESASGDQLLAPVVAAEVALQTAVTAPPQSDGADYADVSLPETVVDDLAERERDLRPFERPGLDDAPEPWGTGKRWMVGTAAGAGIFAVLAQSIWGWPGWRHRRIAPVKPSRPRAAAPPPPPRPAAPEIEADRAEAGAELTALAEYLAAAPAGPRSDQAALAREVAEPLLDSADVLDVVGALVLARGGRARKGFRPCFFDPRHAPATQHVEWRYGDAEVEVPVCGTCRKAVATGRPPETLVAPRRGRLRPYYEGESVWARTGFGSLTEDLGDLARRVAADRGRAR